QGLEADRKELKTGLQPLRDVMAELRQELADVKDAKPRLKAMEAELQQLRKEVIEQQRQFSGLLNDLRQQESAAYSAAQSLRKELGGLRPELDGLKASDKDGKKQRLDIEKKALGYLKSRAGQLQATVHATQRFSDSLAGGWMSRGDREMLNSYIGQMQ